MADASKKVYQKAFEIAKIAKIEMPPTHLTRLELALNFAVFYYEILNDTKSACQLAEQGLNSFQFLLTP